MLAQEMQHQVSRQSSVGRCVSLKSNKKAQFGLLAVWTLVGLSTTIYFMLSFASEAIDIANHHQDCFHPEASDDVVYPVCNVGMNATMMAFCAEACSVVTHDVQTSSALFFAMVMLVFASAGVGYLIGSGRENGLFSTSRTRLGGAGAPNENGLELHPFLG